MTQSFESLNRETHSSLPAIAPEIAPDSVRAALNRPGQPLDAATGALMEARLGEASIKPVQSGGLATDSLEIAPSHSAAEQQARAVAANALNAQAQPAEMPPTRVHGMDFSRVRIHVDAGAAESARAVGARAYTVGSHIAFAACHYDPASEAGRGLLAHELAHVAQQGGTPTGQVMRDTPDAGAAPAPAKTTAPPAATDKTLWFQDPKVAGDPSQPDRKRVFVETTLSQIGTANVRFAYPMSEMVANGYVSKPSQKVTDAKTKILMLIGEVIADLGSYPGGTAAQQKTWKEDRARLKEGLSGLTASKPLNIFIATIESPAELISGKFIPYTDQVYINAGDVGNKSKLEAAIRLPLQNLSGGVSTQSGKPTTALSKDELKKTMLHESLHVMLAKRSIDSETQWDKLKGQIQIQGPSDAQAKAEELVHKYLLAQEEIFAYESVGSLYPPVDQVKATYDVFVGGAESFFKKKGSALKKVSQSITVAEKVDSKAVSWAITYSQPGSLSLVASDAQVLDVILMAWPLAQIKGKGTP